MLGPADHPVSSKARELLFKPCVSGFSRDRTGAESLASLYIGAESNLVDRVLSEVEKESFITLPGKGGHGRLLPPKNYVSQPGRI